MAEPTFEALEQAGWVAKAGAYDELVATITVQAIAPMLYSLGDIAGQRLLDVACGTGHIAASAAQRGARSEGIDFASTMVAKAKERHPGIPFVDGDAERLPYADASFDAVVCGFGLLHMSRPERAIEEAWRVLRRGGRYAFTVWCGPDRGGAFFKLIMEAIRMHGTLDVPLPPAPPMFRFADPAESARVLAQAGFGDAKFTVLPLTWSAATPEAVVQLIQRGTVRAQMLLEAQTARACTAVQRAIVEASEALRRGSLIELSFPAAMATATKS